MSNINDTRLKILTNFPAIATTCNANNCRLRRYFCNYYIALHLIASCCAAPCCTSLHSTRTALTHRSHTTVLIGSRAAVLLCRFDDRVAGQGTTGFWTPISQKLLSLAHGSKSPDMTNQAARVGLTLPFHCEAMSGRRNPRQSSVVRRAHHRCCSHM